MFCALIKKKLSLYILYTIHYILNEKVFHPLGGELLTTGTISIVMWQARNEWRDAVGAGSNDGTERIDLWLVAASGDEAEIARGIDGNCSVSASARPSP